MGPEEATYSLAEYAEMDAKSLELVVYYTQCTGDNPFEPAVNNLTVAFDLLNETAVDLKKQQFCDRDSMNGLSATSSETATTVNDMLATFGCRPLNSVFTQLTHETFCGPFLWGVYMLWVVHVSASFLIWAAFMTFPCVKEPP